MNLLESLISGLPIAATVVDKDTGEIVLANRTAVDLMGIGELNLGALRAVEIVDMEGNPVPYDKLATTQARITNTIHMSIMGVRANGRTRWFSSSANPLMYDSRELVITAFTDITEIISAKKEQEELKHLRYLMVTNFLHEIRTPLTIISGYLEMARTGSFGAVPSEVDELLESAERGAKRLNILTRRAAAVLQYTQPTAVNLRDLIMEVLGDDEIWLMSRKNKSQANLHFAADNLPLVVALVDETKIKTAVFELVVNAVKFTPPGGTITITLERTDRTVKFAVRDTGIGVGQEHKAHFFERFFQADPNSTRRYEGMGLGLSVVKEIVDMHNGRIEVESELGKGSTFTVFLPAWGQHE